MSSWYIQRISKVIWRKYFPHNTTHVYTFAALCVKKIEYCELIIRQANSLHYFNPHHIFVIYADTICKNRLESKKHRFDYPKQITIKDRFGTATRSWTHYKMEMRIENSRLGGIDIDADMIWHSDPIIDRSRPIMFAPAFIFKENKTQSDLIINLFKKPAWLEYTHFVSAFVSIPSQFMTDKLAQDARNYVKMILDDPLTFIEDQDSRDELKRVSEEMAICFALQSNYPGAIRALKADGNKKNKEVLETIYYGCEQKIIS